MSNEEHAQARLQHRYSGHQLPGCLYELIDDGSIALVSRCATCSWVYVERTDRTSDACLKLVGYDDGFWVLCTLPHGHAEQSHAAAEHVSYPSIDRSTP